MANIIKIKRKPLANGAGVPENLSAGELAFSEADAKLFYGLDNAGSVSPIEIAGSGYVINQVSTYAPSKTGSGATGTWNISITGNAGTVTNGVYTSRSVTAGSGLSGGGTLANDITLNIGEGDGITVDADLVAVDNTVVRTTGNQTLSDVKTFTSNTAFLSGISASGTNSLQAASTASAATQFAVFTSSPAASVQSLLTRTPSEVKSDIGLSNVTNDAQIKKLSSSTSGNIPTWDVTTGDQLSNGYSVETTLSGGDGAIPRADAVKTYVDNLLAANDAMLYKGTIDASTNPDYPAGDAGHTYKISVAGKIGGASGPAVEVGDMIICKTDSSATGDHATVGSNWNIIQVNIDGAVIGPVSSTDDALAVFDGTTGKLIKNSSYIPTTVGGNFINLTNPSAISFLRVNADNTISTLSDIDFRNAIGASSSSGSVTSISAGSGMDFSTITNSGSVVLGIPSNITLVSSNGVTSDSHTHAFAPGGSSSQYIRGDGTLSTFPDINDATLTLNVSGIGLSGSQTFTANQSSAATFTVSINSTSSNVANTVVSRDADGDFSAGTITASLNGNATTVTSGVYTSRTISTSSGLSGGGNLSSDRTISLASEYGDAVNPYGTKTKNYVLAAPTGVDGVPSFRGLDAVDIPDLDTSKITTGTLNPDRGGTGQSSYANGELLIGNSTGNTLAKSTLTQGTGLVITNGAGSISIAHADTSTLTGAQGTGGISSITLDDFGHVTAVSTATYLTSSTVCSAIADCTIDGGTF